MAKKSVKIGVRVGGGRPPGYQWNVAILDLAHRDTHGLLSAAQYDHLSRQFRELARQGDPTHSDTIDVEPIEDYYELRDKGGILGPLNIRVFYFVHNPSRTIVVLGVAKKENNGPTPMAIKITMRARKRRYLATFHPGT